MVRRHFRHRPPQALIHAVGTSADNAAAEAFNASMKRETLQGAKRWPGARAARISVFRWVTRYNTSRRHSC
jgi:transposase InsO family protein